MKIDWIERTMTDAENLIVGEQFDQGISILQSLLYEEPGYGSLHNHLGWAYLYYGDNAAQAEVHLKAAMKFDVEYAAPYLHMANLCMRNRRYEEAVDYAEIGLTKSEPNASALYEIVGNAYEMKTEYAKAIRAYRSGAMKSLVDWEVKNLTQGIRRCRRKRVSFFFTF